MLYGYRYSEMKLFGCNIIVNIMMLLNENYNRFVILLIHEEINLIIVEAIFAGNVSQFV